MKQLLLSFLACSLSMSMLQAESVKVTSTAMDPAVEGTLPNVIANAASGSSIEFDFDGTELVFPEETALEINAKSLIFEGVNKKNSQRVRIKGAGSLFNIKGEASVVFKDLIISDFKKIALMVSGSSQIEAYNCLFENNKDAKLSAGNNGGAIRVSSSKAILKNTIFDGNSGNGSYGGGAVCVYGASDLRAENCTFVNNSAAGGGAGLCVKGTGTTGTLLPPKAYIANCTFANNIADFRGALYLVTECTHSEKFNPVVVNCTFVGNLAEKEGAAVCLWSKATTSLNVTMVNNLFAENYITPWMDNSGEKCDVWAFYLAGEVNNANEPLPQTVFQDCVNNMYEAAKPGFFDNKNTIIDFSKMTIFKEIEKNPLDEGDDYYTHKTSKLHGDLFVAMLHENSIANKKGISSYKNVEIPQLDQLGKNRPASPAVGAVEYGEVLSGIQQISGSTTIQAIAVGKNIKLKGITGQAKINIYNLSGVLVWSGIAEADADINLETLPSAIYGIMIQDEKEQVAAKVIIR